MSETGPGADPQGSSTWDNPSWSSSLSDSSLSRPEPAPPSPFSREGSRPEDALGSGPASAASPPPAPDPFHPSATTEPYPPSASIDPHAGYTGPYAAEPAPAEPPPPGFDPQPTPPYGSATNGSAPPYPAPPSPYGEPAPAFGAPDPTFGSLTPAYGSNPYEVNPYQPAYGAASPYGFVPVSHPQSTTAMIFGILSIVFALSCGIGGLLGIPAIIQGRRARAEIDTEPGRYAGRSQATAGIVTGTIGVVIAGLVVVFVIIAFAAAALSGDL